MEKQRGFLKNYTDRLIEKGKCFPNIGLWDGKMGIAVYLLHLARITGDENYERQADEFMDTVYEQLAERTSIFYGDGLLGIDNGVCGVGYYLYRRLKNKPDNDKSMLTLKFKEYLIYLIDWIEELLLKTKEKDDYNDAYFLLCRLHRLDVFNHKIERMMGFCLRKLIDFNCRISDPYELLGIESLKILKSWI